MNKMFKTALTAIASVALCCSINACTQKPVTPNLALVNPLVLVQNSASGKAGAEHLKQLESQIEAQVNVAQKLIEANPGDETLRLQIQDRFNQYKQVLDNEQQKVLKSMNDQIAEVLNLVRSRQKLDVILSVDDALSFDAANDVTNEVLQEMDKTPLAFDAVTIPLLHETVKVQKAQKSKK